MIAVDTNVLVYAHRSEAPAHQAARSVLRELAEGAQPWALPAFVLAEFLRTTTHPSLAPPSNVSEAIAALEGLLDSPTVRILFPGERYWSLLRETILASGARGNLVHDAAIAAVCREWGVTEVVTNDRDFGRFTEFRVRRLPSR